MSGLPIGWESLKCGETFEQISTTKLKVKTKDTMVEGLFPVIDQGLNFIAGYVNDEEKVIEINTPVCIFGDHTRIIKWVDFSFVPGADGTKVLNPKAYLAPKFFYYQLCSLNILDKGYARHFKFLKEADILLPPLSEQVRIANKLDSLLAKVDKAQARLEKIPVQLKRFRQSVLAAATSGELTREWRGTEETGWSSVSFLTLVNKIRSGSGGKALDEVSETKILRSSAVRDMTIDFTDHRYLKGDDLLKSANTLANGDLLFTRLSGSTEYVGNCACVVGLEETEVFQYPDRLFCAKLKEPEYASYLELFFSSRKFKRYIIESIKSSAGHQRITLGVIKEANVDLPPIEEQQEIVRRVESLFALADSVEKQYQTSKARVDRLTQSIIAKAFRGALVPQDPNDEPAAELLKRTQELKIAESKNSKKAVQKRVVKTKVHVMRLDEAPKDYLFRLLENNGGEAHPDVLWKLSGLPIDDFYAKLKQELKEQNIDEDNESADPSFRLLKITNPNLIGA
ncbi:restriction endonuclease subunit S [Leucothrix mucor]|uniref:restriction endonuclease subunit S n=1 Tax=Leucothrix mucor TaxID=45248 RepID=UPI0003B4276E|nr:restriction endonuclease subunit S [Leucothrix mucor]